MLSLKKNGNIVEKENWCEKSKWFVKGKYCQEKEKACMGKKM